MTKAMDFLDKAKNRGMVLGLESMRSLTAALDNPQNKLKNIIHIAGTNGKGSVGAFIEAALIEAGFKVGRYSSPAVFSYYEIFKKNGINITEAEYGEYMEKIESAVNAAALSPTAFEIETALAFLYFHDCDYCIIETGLGGREDATNVIDVEKTAVLTSISMDHMHILGNSTEEIAAEKCGIFNAETTVISAEQLPEAAAVIKQKAVNLPLTFAENPENIRTAGYHQLFNYRHICDLEIPLLGTYQPYNAAAAIETLLHLNIDEQHIKNGLKSAVWHGRFDILSENPLVIADGAHNKNAFSELRKSLELYFPNKKFTFITGVLADKEYREAVRILSPLSDKIFTITPKNPRALAAEVYADEFKRAGKNAVAVNICDIRKIIAEKKGTGDITAAFGSLSFMKEFFDEVEHGTS